MILKIELQMKEQQVLFGTFHRVLKGSYKFALLSVYVKKESVNKGKGSRDLLIS